MNKKLLITLLRKNVDDLTIIADGFFESDDYSPALLTLARRQTEDIQLLIDQLANLNNISTTTEKIENQIEIIPQIVQEEVAEIQAENVPADEIIIETEEEETETEVEFEIQLTDNEPVIVVEQEEIIVNETDEDDDEFNEEDENEDNDNYEDEDVEISISDDENEETEPVAEITLPAAENINYQNIPSQEIEIQVKEPVNETPEEQPTVSNFSTIADKLGHISTPLRHESLYHSGNTLGTTSATAMQKVDDIRRAITIGDRFRFQKELFNNNGEEMNKTLNYINQLATFDESIAFLRSKYQWTDDNPTAEDFYNIVSRKFQ
ncbi:MAG: hypothetical protein LBV75_03955 [Paludibacter sp.]|jgi:hypothetical protein|nr:hypothetical protein [Paludibacter sp.]